MDNTLSIVPSDGTTNEFPVLKAFQEYIDAEQAKARKRMLGLSVFFIILLIVVVITFVLILTTVVNRNQALSDRLLDYALKERDRAVQVAPQPVPQTSVQDMLRPLIERLEREQAAMKALYEKQQKEAENRYKEAESLYEKRQKEAEAKANARNKERDEEIRKAKEALEKERLRLKQENDRQAEIERHRRRLYPDYYRIPAQPDVASPRPSPPAEQPQPQKTARQQTLQTPSSAPVAKPVEPKNAPKLSTIKPVTYFNVDDDDGVPFLLETPKKQPQK